MYSFRVWKSVRAKCLVIAGQVLFLSPSGPGRIGQVLFLSVLRVYGRGGVQVYKLVKKRRGQYPAILTEQAWSIKDLLYGFRGNFSCGTRRVVRAGKIGPSCSLW